MGKRVILAMAVAGLVLAMAGPALAKGPFGEQDSVVSGSVSIHGPKRGGSIFLDWRGGCGIFSPCTDIKDLESDFLAVAADAGLSGGGVPSYARTYYIRPSMSRLGPAYTMTWTLVSTEGRRAVVRQTLYPYAPGRPWVYTPAGQRVGEATLTSGWAATPPSLVALLRTYGLPKAAPAAPTAAAADAS